MAVKKNRKLTYADAGVDIKAGEAAVQKIKTLAHKTFTPGVLSDIGSFGGFFRPDFGSMKRPVLISSADGVGTKLKLAFMTGRHNSCGEDLVNHCVNDILVHGAKPLFFLDYIATGKVHPEIIAEIVEGFSRGCLNTGTALLGGETAEMADFYQPGEYDLAGFIVGMVDQDKIINGERVTVGDVCIGLISNGLHTNGYTLARKAAFEIAGLRPDDRVNELGDTIGDVLLKVHRCYGSLVHPLLDNFDIHAMAHITGGGISGNLNRVLPGTVDAEIENGSWPVLPIFTWLKKVADIDPDDMYSTFNMGIGFILVVGRGEAEAVMKWLSDHGERAYRIGQVVPGNGRVQIKG